MSAKLYKAAEVCDVAQLQPYVLRSWEKEFPGIGVASATDGPRMYRQSDIDQVLRIRELVFGEGLTLSGARRKLEGSTGASPAPAVRPLAPVPAVQERPREAAPVGTPVDRETRERIARVREELRSLLTLLSSGERHAGGAATEYHLQPPPPSATVRTVRARKRA